MKIFLQYVLLLLFSGLRLQVMNCGQEQNNIRILELHVRCCNSRLLLASFGVLLPKNLFLNVF
ncbi:hypothetical protein C7E23_11850 [Elizabethkingia anophelis]|nr:hypothetical protein C7E23_11850 [Elizabethkingia anophelis]